MNKIAGPIIALGIATSTLSGCNSVPEELETRLAPLKSEAVYFCELGNEDSKNFYQTKRNSWVTDRKNKIMDLLGYNPKCVQWECQGGSTTIPFGIVENSENCPDVKEEEIQKRFNSLSEEDKKTYGNAIAGSDEWDYNTWKLSH